MLIANKLNSTGSETYNFSFFAQRTGLWVVGALLSERMVQLIHLRLGCLVQLECDIFLLYTYMRIIKSRIHVNCEQKERRPRIIYL